ncbi:MAG: hypothetical protein K8R88_01155 [Armatimonadetes bacterium]|nr:hypothetical protein [Armatimonadota bacterium]
MSQQSRWLPFTSLALTAIALGAGWLWRGVRDTGQVAETAISGTLLASASKSDEIPVREYYDHVVELLKKNYVEEVTDEQKLAAGGVRGMILSLSDPLANYMSPEQFASYKKTRAGQFDGVGVELDYLYKVKPTAKPKIDENYDPYAFIPDLVVSAVVPGSSAEKNGVKIGDRIDSVDGRWLLSSSKVKDFRDKSKTIRSSVVWDDSKESALKDLDEQIKKGTTLSKTREKLIANAVKPIEVTLERAGQKLTVKLDAKAAMVPAIKAITPTEIQLRFFTTADQELQRVTAKNIILDLRNSGQGDFDSMVKCLGIVGGAGKYGFITNQKGAKPVEFKVDSGSPKFGSVELVVDSTTRGMAKVFATALSSAGKAKLMGTLSPEGYEILTMKELPDGSGYTLPIGVFSLKAIQGAKS